MTAQTNPAIPTLETLYSETVKVVSSDIKQTGQWKALGAKYALFFPTREGMESCKSDLILNAIVPGFPKDDQATLAYTPVRKGGKEYKALSEDAQANEDKKREARKNVNAKAEVYFTRLTNYAFPKPKAERGAQLPTGEGEGEGDDSSTGAVKTPETRIIGLLNDAIGKAQKMESPTFDVIAFIAKASEAIAIVNNGQMKS